MKQQVFRAGGAIRPLPVARRKRRWNRVVFFKNIVEPVLFLLCFAATMAGVYAMSIILYRYL